jgi:hypothetical protein
MHRTGRRHGRALPALAAAAAASACSYVEDEGWSDVARVEVYVERARLAPGDTAGVVGYAFREDGRLQTHARRAVTFRSSDAAVATVAGAGRGVVRGVAPGSAWLIGESAGRRDSVPVRVTPVP